MGKIAQNWQFGYWPNENLLLNWIHSLSERIVISPFFSFVCLFVSCLCLWIWIRHLNVPTQCTLVHFTSAVDSTYDLVNKIRNWTVTECMKFKMKIRHRISTSQIELYAKMHNWYSLTLSILSFLDFDSVSERMPNVHNAQFNCYYMYTTFARSNASLFFLSYRGKVQCRCKIIALIFLLSQQLWLKLLIAMILFLFFFFYAGVSTETTQKFFFLFYESKR